MSERIPYRKLPGHRRGFIRGSSVWLGPDHLLLVNSYRFREEYKRYYFRDIQAIVAGEAPRFHLSTRSAAIGYFWLLAFVITFRFPKAPWITGGVGVALVIAWAYLSATCSCRCRLYTAVSRDTLPSVYRTWVAARFLRAVEPHITAVQGAMEQSANIAMLSIGPAAAAAVASNPLPEAESGSRVDQGSISYYLLLAVLFGDAVWRWLTLSYSARWAAALTRVLPLAVIAAAIFVIIQRRWKRVTAGEQNFAITTLVVSAMTGYAGLLADSFATALRSTPMRRPLDPMPFLHVAGEVGLGINLALGVAGVAVLLASRSVAREPQGLSLQ